MNAPSPKSLFGQCPPRAALLPGLVLAAACAWTAPVSQASVPMGADPALPRYAPGAQVSGSVTGVTGMDSVEAMYGAWAGAFRGYHPGASFDIVQKDVAPEERIALGPDTGEVFNPDDRAYEDKYGYEPFRVRICMGAFVLKSHVSAIGVFVNKANPIRKLSLAELDAIYSAERRRGYPADIATWGELGLAGVWAERPVHLYGFYWRDDVTAYFRKLALLDAPFKASYAVPGDGGLARRTPVVAKAIMDTVASDPCGIAFANFSYATAGVKALALVDAKGATAQPCLTDIASGRYPLERYLYFYVNRKPGRPLDPLIKEFITFVLSRDGQELVGRDHYLPLTAAMAARERAKLE